MKSLDKQQKIKTIFEELNKLFPEPYCELKYSSDFELLVAVILSAQCTDKRVNQVTSELFKNFKTPNDFANISQETLEKYIYSTGFFRNKAKNIISTSKILVEKFNSELPKSSAELMQLPGVGRKVANVVSSIINNESVVGVDTHFFRVANRLGLVNAKNPLDTEKQWIKNYPNYLNHQTHLLLVLFGRYYCSAKNPKCQLCKFKELCNYYKG